MRGLVYSFDTLNDNTDPRNGEQTAQRGTGWVYEVPGMSRTYRNAQLSNYTSF
jgi:hypothetical protein